MRRGASALLWGLGFWLLAYPSWAEDDFQIWKTLEMKKRLGGTWELFFRPEIRIRDDASELFYHEYRQGVRFKPSKHLVLGLNYLFARNKGASGKTLDEHAGEFDYTPQGSWGRFNLSMRGRVAIRTLQRSAGEQEFQLRFMPKIAYPTRIGSRKVAPYLAEDLFYDYSRDAWNQHRFFVGAAFPLGKRMGAEFELDAYYMAQGQRSARKDWNTNHTLGTRLSVQW